SPRLTIDLASKALSAGKVQRLPDANNSGKRIARFNLGRMGIFSESAVSEVSRTSQEDYAPIVGPTALAVGAALGVALSVLSRKGFTLLFRRFSKEKASPPPQDSSSGSSSKKS
ncbi:MAG: hypothetical protein KKA28_02700, partial [Planctomycetes bacterium]|nr:hypothetical protein [Planctomycetota bacterium]MCG2682041.1 hypothetical protein [Planctomycetales bacterium]